LKSLKAPLRARYPGFNPGSISADALLMDHCSWIAAHGSPLMVQWMPHHVRVDEKVTTFPTASPRIISATEVF
jgi:hypothetical protein